MQRKLLYLVIFLMSCSLGSFDISQPFITIHPKVEDKYPEKVHWVDYTLSYDKDGCILVYLKHNLSCGECDIMDETFKDKEVVSILNDNFIAYKGTEDMPDGEREINSMPGLTPAISISSEGKGWFWHDTTAIPRGAFIGILKESLVKCNDHRNRKSG